MSSRRDDEGSNFYGLTEGFLCFLSHLWFLILDLSGICLLGRLGVVFCVMHLETFGCLMALILFNFCFLLVDAFSSSPSSYALELFS